MPFGEVIIGSPGSGKSTYAYGKYQLLTALNRKCIVVNLDPANDPGAPYPTAVSLSELITLQDVMEGDEALGPNGGILYCLEYLEKNFDWLTGRLEEEVSKEGDTWVLFDLPGQVELSTNHDSLKRVVDRLGKVGYRLAAVHLCDAHYVTDAAKYVSVLLLSLRTMLHMGLPHVNVLSKVDLISKYGDLDFNLGFYTEVQDLHHLANSLSSTHPRFNSLTMTICDIIEDFGLVGFETLAVEDKKSMLNLMRIVDRALGYVFVAPTSTQGGGAAVSGVEEEVPQRGEALSSGTRRKTPSAYSTTQPNPGAGTTSTPNTQALFTSALSAIPGAPDVGDVQERWIDNREEWDKWEEGEWRREGAAVAQEKANRNKPATGVDTKKGRVRVG